MIQIVVDQKKYFSLHIQLVYNWSTIELVPQLKINMDIAEPPKIIIFCTDIAEPTTIFDLLEFRWFRDWFRRSAISVAPK